MASGTKKAREYMQYVQFKRALMELLINELVKRGFKAERCGADG